MDEGGHALHSGRLADGRLWGSFADLWRAVLLCRICASPSGFLGFRDTQESAAKVEAVEEPSLSG